MLLYVVYMTSTLIYRDLQIIWIAKPLSVPVWLRGSHGRLPPLAQVTVIPAKIIFTQLVNKDKSTCLGFLLSPIIIMVSYMTLYVV